MVRKAITSYYTDQEQREMATAAKQQRISMSGFVASGALTLADLGFQFLTKLLARSVPPNFPVSP